MQNPLSRARKGVYIWGMSFIPERGMVYFKYGVCVWPEETKGDAMPETVTVSFDEDVLLATNMTSKEFADSARFTVAAKLWMDGKLTAGQAARLCGMAKAEFLYELPKHGYPMSNLGPDDLDDELALVRMERLRGK